ncbi:MAG: efflux RND transporter permease subunit, partial [Nannocystaceae bacterium]
QATGQEGLTQQGGGGRQVTVQYSFPSHIDVEEADVFFRELEGWFDEHRGEYNATGEFIQINPGNARVQMFFEPPKPGDIPYIEQAKAIYELLPVPPGWEKRSRFSASDGGRQSALSVAIYGDDHRTLRRVKEQLERDVLRVEGVVAVGGDSEEASESDELYLEVDPDLSERYGVASTLIANTVGYAIRGSPLPRYYAEERDVDVSIRYRPEDREELENLLEFKVPGTAGVALPIKSFVQPSVQKGEKTLIRYNKRTAERLSVELDPDDRAGALQRLKNFFDDYRLPEGISFDADEELRQVRGQQEEFMLAALLGSLFIFFLMGFLFESLLLPLSVMPSIPLAMVGVWWFLWLTGENLDP